MDEKRWLNDAEYRAWIGYRRMRGRLDLRIARDLQEDSGLSEADYDVLSNLGDAERHRARLSDLAARMLWSKSRLSHHITRMQARGLVVKEECADDGRGAVVALTEKGLRAIEEAAPAHVESVRRNFIDLLTEGEIATLSTITERVLARLGGAGSEG
ncbi:MarR family winged helix-turn-helix transcriptional regulator [Actinomadura sp. DC4]|uniref:MarR family winged helix-turn-helix transcriptional regulator n=1 Tax=Actinomadura sp. DC4 TaxID=3055069 RepID=UPI0025B0CC59|nr:MarR family winged helix-turn-helix transcriptional regulator [Actinomadura sp. DC4]MDN3351236.1 MarR family winged helix-turn-helix transcriptional regulator [Actinomadura sp. DC4]